MPQLQRTELKTGKRSSQLNSRIYKDGEILFDEGSSGRELFIIQEGEVSVYRETEDGSVELAKVGGGGVIGEMSLLDNQLRSASVRATTRSVISVINDKVFSSALKSAPLWLTSIVKIVVSRLRDANKRIDQSVLIDRERGIVSLILLLLLESKYEYLSRIALSHDTIIVEAYYVCRLKKKEIEHLLVCFETTKLIEIIEDSDHKKHVCFNDMEVFSLYFEYLTLKSQQKKFREASVNSDAVGVLSNIAYIAQKSGTATSDGTRIAKSKFMADLVDKKPAEVEKILSNLRRMNFINIMPEGEEIYLYFRYETLSRIKKIQKWLPKFESVGSQ